MRLRAGALFVAVCCMQCTSANLRARPGTAELRGAHYSDNSGLTVATLGANVEQPLSQEVTATVRAVADHVIVHRTIVEVPPAVSANQATGHQDVEADVVTSASSSVVGGEGSDKWRFEAMPGVRWEGELSDQPASGALEARVSSEPDFFSLLALAHASTSFFEDNTTVAIFGGFGRDRVTPSVAPPGQDDAWPATHDRVLAGASLSQLVSSAVRVSASGSFTLQRGMLSNPYRRAAVRTSLFPEKLPDARDRFTASLGASAFLGWRSALHLRLGGYADSWGVQAVVPEAAWSKELSDAALINLHYRYYLQSNADFYQTVYSNLAPILAGDMRLGRLHDQTFGLDLQWLLLGRREDFGALVLEAGVDLSLLKYEQLASDMIVAKIFQVALLASY